MKKEETKILLIEDDQNLGGITTDYLTAKGFHCQWENNGESGYQAFVNDHFDIVILDVMMPFKDGFSLATDIRSANEEIPLIFLTAKSLKEDVIKGFKIGADDYLIKPFDSEILLLKIKSLFKRKLSSNKNNIDKLEYEFASYIYNSKFRELRYKNDKPIKLSPKEGKL